MSSAAAPAFKPRPGSVADRAIAYLQSQPAAGTEVSSAALAEAIGAPAGSIIACLQPALDAGLVFARKKGGHARSPAFWSLVDHDLGKTIIDTGKLEVDHIRATGDLRESGFIAPALENHAASTGPANGITGIVRHRLAG